MGLGLSIVGTWWNLLQYTLELKSLLLFDVCFYVHLTDFATFDDAYIYDKTGQV